MKKGVVIVNTSRGALINTEDLIEKIKSKKVGAACLDVYEEEGDIFFQDYSGHIVQDDQLARLISMPNVIVTSHQAFLTTEALDNIAKTSIENLINFNKGTPIRENEVCYMCKNQTECKKLLKQKSIYLSDASWQEPAAAEDGYLTPEIQDELSQLSEPERRVITLSVFGGYTSREIAGILKKREGSIRSIKSRALAKLREKNADL